MNHLCASALLLAVMLGCAAARAADWVPVAVAGSENQYFYDRSKLNIKDDEISYWQKVVYHAPQSVQGGEAASALLLERIHCAEHTAKRFSYLYYSETGETLEHVTRDESEPAPIIPDSAGDAFEQALCPQVWQKQEEARISAERKGADGGAGADKKKTGPSDSQADASDGKAPKKPEAVPTGMPQEIEQLY